jgi:transcription-repair coupling factor (superfamily II helicase)
LQSIYTAYKKEIKEFFEKKEFFKTKIKIKGIPYSSHNFIYSLIFQSLSQEKFILIYPTNQEAELGFREAQSFFPPHQIAYLPGPDNIPYEYTRYQPEMKRERIQTLSRIASPGIVFIYTSVIGFLKSTISQDRIQSFSLEVKKGQDYTMESLSKSFIQLGYTREEVCEQFGTFSIKGGKIDIYSSSDSYPYRLDFFGDTLEEIKLFDPATQKSFKALNSAKILACDEYILSSEEIQNYKDQIKNSDPSLVKPEFYELHIVEELIPGIRKGEGILSLFSKPPIICFNDEVVIKEKAIQTKREYQSLFERRSKEIIAFDPSEILSLEKEYKILTEQEYGLTTDPMPPGPEEESFPLLIKSSMNFKGKIREFKSFVEEKTKEGFEFIITSSFQAQLNRIRNLFQIDSKEETKDEEVHPLYQEKNITELNFFNSDLKNGFFLESENLYIITENDIFGRAYRRKVKYKKTSSKAIQSFVDLKEGDYVVHIHHGIGKFKKIEKLTTEGKEKEFLKLEYNGGDVLFVPLDQISLVQRYVGGVENPRLDSFGKDNWKKLKSKVQESIDELAEDLVKLYSNRIKVQGYAYPPDSIYQEEFEAEFEYEETPDQIEAIENVKRDLESTKPMDRLICGDVGYGKTEVAIRAAFKVIMAGRQVLLLAPTTILALQHFNNLEERYKNYPIKIALVSRFKSPKEIREAMEHFEKGSIDMLVGTHSILSPKLKPKNLGLLIIDEEQRFGVNHKEAIKKLKNLVDVLTLTATPIPRTLHMALSGIRDLSIIATPPKNRQSVDTYVIEDNDDILKEALRRELNRDGQIFYLFNRVEEIESEAEKLRELIPRASVGILHGQMTEDDIEETLVDFYSRKYDILVTTTIIESGIDIPNVNTLIIKRADMFGLSQLYQIRGRVGRSDRKAYAYLFYPPGKVITEQAEKRLNTIYEYQELGSGFKVAMRDLEIRGAGNLLGKEQSGDIMEIGFDLYIKMLEEAIAKIKGEELEPEIRTVITLKTHFLIPDTYIPDTRQKIEFYKKLEGSSDLQEINDIESEMVDRFGPLPEKAETFLSIEKLRALASQMGFESITETQGEIRLKAGAYFKGNTDSILKLIQKNIGLGFVPKEPNVLRYETRSSQDRERIEEILYLLYQMEGSSTKKR